MGNRVICIIVLFICLLRPGIPAAIGQVRVGNNAERPGTKYLVIRTDDAGMSHSVNMGLKKLLETVNMPVSVSIMFPCPWYQEAVNILKEHQDRVTVGIHLVMNSEWQYYRWGPVVGQEAVPSLVDKDGYFFHSASDLYRNHPDPTEIEKELRAQIKRALASGLDIQYVDYHMGTVINDPQFRKITEKLAKEYGLGMFGYFGEANWSPQYRAAPEDKIDSLITLIPKLKPGYNYLITHVGIDNPELGAMKDMNTGQPLANMAKNRQAVLTALTSDKFRQALRQGNIELITFKQLINMEGLDHMKNPFPGGS